MLLMLLTDSFFFGWGGGFSDFEVTDQRLTKVSLGVTINVSRLTEVTLKSNEAQLFNIPIVH